MQKAIDAAWESKEPEAVKKQQELFPDGKPSVEDFITKNSRDFKETIMDYKQ